MPILNVSSHLLGNLAQAQAVPVVEPSPWYLRPPTPKPILRLVPPPPVPTPNPPSFWKGVFQGLGRSLGWGLTLIFAVGDSSPRDLKRNEATEEEMPVGDADATSENWRHISECTGNGSPIEDCYLNLPHPNVVGWRDQVTNAYAKRFVDRIGDFLADRTEDVLENLEEAWAEYLERIRREQNDDPAPRETAISIDQPTAKTKQIASGSPKIVASIGSSSTVASPSPSTTRVAPPETDDDDDLGAKLDKLEDAIWVLDRAARAAGLGNETALILVALAIRKDETVQARFDRIAETLKGKDVTTLISKLAGRWEDRVVSYSRKLAKIIASVRKGTTSEYDARSKIDILRGKVYEFINALEDFNLFEPLSAAYLLIGISENERPISTLRAMIHDVRNGIIPLSIGLEKGIRSATGALQTPTPRGLATVNHLLTTVIARRIHHALSNDVHLSYRELHLDISIPYDLQDDLSLVISEAVTNGIKYRDKRKLNKEVTVSVRFEAGILTVKIGDNGIGMTEEEIEIAEHGDGARFAKDLASGTGKGIGTIKKICDGHQWEHHLTSTPGKGTTHIVRIDTSMWLKVMH